VTPIFNVLTDEVSLASAIQGLIDAVLVSVVVSTYVPMSPSTWVS
jgi:hypothetical protein